MIALTAEQRAAALKDNNVYISACPGSGKTRVILAKLLAIADDLQETPFSVGCITYTNAAVEEIEQRLRQYGNERLTRSTEVMTIHSFCLQFILRPYRWLVPEVPHGFKILSPHTQEFERIVTAVEDEFRRPIGRTTFDDYASIQIDVDGSPIGTGIRSGIVTGQSARRYWDFVRAAGFLDFSMILYYSLRILSEHPFIGKGISSKFSWLLVDEYQDTTNVQLEILKKINDASHTKFFLVGDESQSIQGFAGARIDLANAFVEEIAAATDTPLTGNFRSSRPIVTTAENVISRTPPMTAIGPNADVDVEPVYVHCGSAVEAVTDHFLPMLEEHGIPLGKAAVLAPWWQHLVPIARTLRQFDVPVFGPGARPYKRSRLFASLAEQLGACAESDHLLGLPGVERSIFRLLQEATAQTRFDVFSYKGRCTALSLVYEVRNLAAEFVGGAEWLVQAAQRVSTILIADEWIAEEHRGLLPASANEMLSDMERANVDLENLQIADLGLFADPDKAIKLITLHNSKGREFDAVAMVHMNEGQIPNFNARTDAEFEEALRLFYVGTTRPRKILMYASDQSHRQNRPSRYLLRCNFG